MEGDDALESPILVHVARVVGETAGVQGTPRFSLPLDGGGLVRVEDVHARSGNADEQPIQEAKYVENISKLWKRRRIVKQEVVHQVQHRDEVEILLTIAERQ